MRKLKVVTVLLLSVILVLGLAACSGGGNNKDNASNNSSNNTGNNNDKTPAVDEPPAEAPINLNGRVVKIATWWDEGPTEDGLDGPAAVAKLEEIQKKYNMTFQFINVPFGDIVNTFVTTTLAGEPFADVVFLEYKRAFAPARDGLLIPLSEYTTGSSDVNNQQQHLVKLPPMGGVEYAFGKKGIKSTGLHFNYDVFKKLGIKDPQQLFAEGKWTWETFLETARAATRDTDNDGKTDVWGLSGWPADLTRHLAAVNDANFVHDADMKEGITDPKLIEALEFVNKLVNEEKIMKVKTGDKMDWNETRTFKDGDVAMALMYDWDLGDVTFDFGVVPFPKGPSGSGRYVASAPDLNGMFIPKGVKDPQIVYQLVDELQQFDRSEEYVGQNWLESRYKHEEDIQMIRDNISSKIMIAIEEGVPDFPFFAILDEVLVQNQSVAAVVEKYKEPAQAALDALDKK